MRSPFCRPHTLCRPLRRRNPPLSDAFLIVRRPFHLPDRLTKTPKVSKIHKGRDRNDLPNPLTRSNPVVAPPGGPAGSLPSFAKPVAKAPAHAPNIPGKGRPGFRKGGLRGPRNASHGEPSGKLRKTREGRFPRPGTTDDARLCEHPRPCAEASPRPFHAPISGLFLGTTSRTAKPNAFFEPF